MQITFGTDGWRGVIARDFTFDNLSTVAQATMDYLNREGLGNKGLIIGYDRRFLSRDFARRVAEVAAGNGISVRLTEDYAPTPAVSWAVRETGSGAGIMITASHNPPEYNGFKVKEAFGGSALPVTTKILKRSLPTIRKTGVGLYTCPSKRLWLRERLLCLIPVKVIFIKSAAMLILI